MNYRLKAEGVRNEDIACSHWDTEDRYHCDSGILCGKRSYIEEKRILLSNPSVFFLGRLGSPQRSFSCGADHG